MDTQNERHAGEGGRDPESRQGSSATDDPKAQAEHLAQSVKAKARGFVEQQKHAGADQVDTFARAVHRAAQELESDMPKAAGYIHDAAARLDEASSRLRERSMDQLMASIGDFARAQPAAFFGGAIVAGFAISRFLKSSGDHAAHRS
jgi:hypothetical protein